MILSIVTVLPLWSAAIIFPEKAKVLAPRLVGIVFMAMLFHEVVNRDIFIEIDSPCGEQGF